MSAAQIGISDILAKYKGRTLEELLALESSEADAAASLIISDKDLEIERLCEADPLYWLQNHTRTENPQYIALGLPFKAPFPKKSYFVPLFKAFESSKRLFIPKSRDMMTSWSVMGFSAYRGQWFKEETIVQTESEDKAAELVEYVRQLVDNQDECLKQRHLLKTRTTYEIAWANGGRVISLPKGESKIRLYHPTRYVMDEAAYLPEAESCYNAAHPVCQQIIAISSAAPGWFGDMCTR